MDTKQESSWRQAYNLLRNSGLDPIVAEAIIEAVRVLMKDNNGRS